MMPILMPMPMPILMQLILKMVPFDGLSLGTVRFSLLPFLLSSLEKVCAVVCRSSSSCCSCFCCGNDSEIGAGSNDDSTDG